MQSPVSPHDPLPPVIEGDDNRHGNTNSGNHNDKSSSTHTSNNNPIPTTNSHSTGSSGGELAPPLSSDHNPTAGGERRRRRSSSAHDSAAMAAELRRTRGQVEEVMGDLARVKLELAEATSYMEQKKMEARQALLREAQAVREVDTARNYIAVLEQRVSCPAVSSLAQEAQVSEARPTNQP